MLKPRHALFLLAEADDQSKAGAAGAAASAALDPAAALAQIEDKTLPMSQRIGVAVSALKGIPPAEQFTKVKAELETTKQALATRDGELATANKQITALQADVATFETSNAALHAENKTLKAAEQDLAKRASGQAKAIVQSVGIEATKLPAASDNVVSAADAAASRKAATKELEDKLALCKTHIERRALVAAFDTAHPVAKK